MRSQYTCGTYAENCDNAARCNRHNTGIRGRDSWGSRASHGPMYLILGGASPQRVPLASAEATILPVSTALAGCRLLHCTWYKRGQPMNTNRAEFRDQHTQRSILNDHGGQSSAQGPSGGATRGGGSTIVVLFCTLHSTLSAGCRRGWRQTGIIIIASDHANFEKVKVDRSDAYLEANAR